MIRLWNVRYSIGSFIGERKVFAVSKVEAEALVRASAKTQLAVAREV